MELYKKIDDILVSDVSINDGITALLSLEKEYPDNVRLQVEIGKAYLSFNEIERAGIYLEKAKSLYDKNKRSIDNQTRYLMYTLLSLYKYEKESYENALDYVNKASKVKVDDHSSDEIMRARVLSKLDDVEKSLELFRNKWETSKDEMGIDVIEEYLLLELGQKNWEKALGIFDYIEYRFGQVRSLGALETQIYNNVDYEFEKILSYVKEIEYRRFSGEIDTDQIMQNLSVLPREEISNDGLILIDVINLFYQENYTDAAEKLAILDHEVDYPYYRYFILVVQMLAGKGNQKIFSQYLSDEFEKRFGNTGGYHYYLWNGLKKGDGKYSFGVVKETLERCIVLSANTIYAQESRLELGRLLGLSDKEARSILIKDELNEIYYTLADTNAPISTIIPPVLEVITLQNNVYTNLAVDFLKKMITLFPKITRYLEQNKDTLSAVTKKSLLQIGIDL